MASKKVTNTDTIEITEQAVEQAEPKFSKEQIIASAKYVHRRDLVDALLDSDKQYTTTEVDQRVDKFMKGTVK